MYAQLWVSVIVMILGLIIYLIAGNAQPTNPPSVKVCEVGRLMFFAGMLAFLLHADTLVKFFGPGR